VGAEQDRESAARLRAREVGLFRYGLIADALDPGLSTKQRGRLVRAVAAQEHAGPMWTAVRVSRATLDRWIRAYRAGGFEALVPAARRPVPQTPAEILALAAALKKEAPGRTAAQVAVVLAAHAGYSPSARTLQRHFAALGLSRLGADGGPPAVFGRFEAEAPNARWVGDALHGPVVAGRKAILIAFLDDHSRTVTAARWGYAENSVALRETLRVGLAARGLPRQVYVDNGAMFIDAQLRRACAVLGIRLVHSRPGQPAGRGKIERFFRSVRDQFLVEIAAPTGIGATAGTAVTSLAELNSLFTAWVEQVYHQRRHTETGDPPLARFLTGGPPAPVPADRLAEAFRWAQWRTVSATATVSLHGNLYEVDPALAGTKVELVFDPFDLSDIDVRHHDRPHGKATPFRIRRHTHPKARTPQTPPATPTGIDYLRLVADRHTQSLGARLHYAHLDQPAAPTPPDPDGLNYHTDLVALAERTGDQDDRLDAELAGFAAPAAQDQDHPASTGDEATDKATSDREATR
jgi:putative transposase